MIRDFKNKSKEERIMLLSDSEFVKEVLMMPPAELNAFGHSLTIEEMQMFVLYISDFIKMDRIRFNCFFNTFDSTIQKKFFDDEEFLAFYMEAKKTPRGFHPFMSLPEDVKLYILEKHNYIMSHINNLEYIYNLSKENQRLYLDSLDTYIKNNNNDELKNTPVTELKYVYSLYHDKDYSFVKAWCKREFQIEDEQMFEGLFNLVVHNHAKLTYALTLKTELEWLLYLKFGIYIPSLDEKIEKLGIKLNKELLNKVRIHDINCIYRELDNTNELNDYEKLILSLNIYSILGLDNSLKLVRGKFSNITDCALNRAARLEFIDSRREYRIKHQDEFYGYQLFDKVKKCFKDEEYSYLEDVFKISNTEIDEYINEIYSLWKKNENHEEWDAFLARIIKTTIIRREKNLEKEHIEKFKKTYFEKRNNEVTIKNVFECFRDIDLSKISYDSKGRPVVNSVLVKFLLGNEKVDNDCLVRLVLNKLAFGLNYTLANTINHFKTLNDIIEKSKGKMNINSILDVIDASKILLYELEPDEQDISLDTIAKIQSSRQHCNDTVDVIIRKVKKLHHERKRKVASTIPFVHGVSMDGVSYGLLEYDDEKVLTAGIDTGCCFKLGAMGEDFLRYCALDKNGAILALTTKEGNYYICPLVRNGNSIYGNGIDPEPKTEKETEELLTAIKECFSKMCLRSDRNEPIEIGVITDLHNKNYFEHSTYEKFNSNEAFMIGEYCYTDYYKPTIQNYIIYKERNVETKYYNPNIVYNMPRQEPYTYISMAEQDKERINLLINSINYTIYKEELIKEKSRKNAFKTYKQFNVDDFKSISGAKDWFVGIKDNLTVESRCLPYDKRAKVEMYNALAKIEDQLNFLETMEENILCKKKKV